MLVYTISKGTNKSYVYDIYRGARGEKGDQGPQGEQGIQGIPGTAATIQVGSVTSGAAPSVVNSGTPNAAILDFVLEKGEKGEQGDKGQAAGFGTPTSSVTSLPAGSQATVSVTATGDATQKVFDFDFGIPSGAKGDTGAKGDKGDKGDTGDAAGFGTPTISVTSLPAGSTATATVSATGPDTAKVFDFDFGIPTGSNAWNIEVSYFTSSTMVLKAFKNNEAYSGTIFAYLTYGDGTTSQRTSSPMMLTATSGTITITSNEFSDIATVLADATKTNFYFEFQETFTGSIFYTVNYVRNGAGSDVWEVQSFSYSKYGPYNGTYRVKIYKNGVEQTSGNYYVWLYRWQCNGSHSQLGYGWLSWNNSAKVWEISDKSLPVYDSDIVEIKVYDGSSSSSNYLASAITPVTPKQWDGYVGIGNEYLYFTLYFNGRAYSGSGNQVKLRAFGKVSDPLSLITEVGISSLSFNSGTAQKEISSVTGLRALLDNPNVKYFEAIFYGMDGWSSDKLLCTTFFPRTADSISSGENGYVTGDQVYTQIGNINTILQSI